MIRIFRVGSLRDDRSDEPVCDVERVIEVMLNRAYVDDCSSIKVSKSDGAITLWRHLKKDQWTTITLPALPPHVYDSFFEGASNMFPQLKWFDLSSEDENGIAFCVKGIQSDVLWRCDLFDDGIGFRRISLLIGEPLTSPDLSRAETKRSAFDRLVGNV